jgi:tetratricopeptide (TPR) repeat protein
LQVDLQPGQGDDTPLDLSGLTKAQNFVGRAAEIRELQTNLDPANGKWRAAVIHAIGGMGKTVLAARLGERMALRLDGVISLRMSPSTTVQNVLDHIGDFLFAHNARFNLSEIHAYQGARAQLLEPNVRLGMLAQILRRLRLLVVFDNCEDVLPGGMQVSRAGQGEASLDPELLPLIASLVGSVDGPTRFLFTSRVDFSPVEENRLADAVGHLPLKEMGFREAVYLMETLPPLDRLPIALSGAAGRDGIVETEAQSKRADTRPHPLSMRDVYSRLGGHPYHLSLFARHAARTSVGQVLDDLSAVQEELLEFTLLEKAVEQLPDRAALLLRRGTVYEEPVPIEGLAFMLGDEQDAMPDVTAELSALLAWGLAAREPGTEDYSLHSLVRDWAQATWKDAERKDYLRRAARYWIGVSKDNRDLGDHLRARHYLFEAGDYEGADDIVQATHDYLFRWGYVGLLLSLLRQSMDTLEGRSKAIALGNLSTIFKELGDYKTAMQFNQQVLQVFEESGDRRNLAVALHQIAMLYSLQGEYQQALEFYQRSLKIDDEISDRAGMAKSLGEMGNLHSRQGQYQQALEFYQQSFKIEEEIGDRAGTARSLHGIGNLYFEWGEYQRALEFYQQSSRIFEDVGDRSGTAPLLHQMGVLYQTQKDYPRALEFYRRSLKIKEEIGDRAGVASSLHQIGMLHQDQGDYKQAMEFYQLSLKIKEEIGSRAGVASSLGQIGLLYEQMDHVEEAIHSLLKAFLLFAGMGMPQAEQAKRDLNRLRSKAGGEAFAAAVHAMGLPPETQTALFEALGDSQEKE